MKSRAIAPLVAALCVGLLAGIGPRLFAHDRAAALRVDSQHSVSVLHLPGSSVRPSSARPDVTRRQSPVAPGIPARSPAAAVGGWLAALQRGDFVTSYGLLSRADRQQVLTPATWEHEQSRRAHIMRYGALAVRGTSRRADVAVALTLEPRLDEIVGAVPDRADAVLVALPEDGGWRVAFAKSRFSYRYAPDSGALDAARRWADAAQHCSAASQWRAALYGDNAATLARSLCHARGAITVGSVRELAGRTDTASLVAAFGPQVGLWARVVPLRTPHAIDLVLAPLGQRWLVIGALSPSSEGGQG